MKENKTHDYEYVICNICDSTDFVPITTYIENNNKLYLGICKNCGLAYLNPRWTKIKYTKYYETEYDGQYRPNLLLDSQAGAPKFNIILERFKEEQLLPARPVKILDIGSGEGTNLLAFREEIKGCQLYAIEPSINSRDILTKRGIHIIATDVDDDWDKEFNSFFDIIILRHALEHFLDPSSSLKKVNKALKSEGISYIAVPNNLSRVRNKGWLRLVHTYYFNKFSLANILYKEGFNLISLREGDKYNALELVAFTHKDRQPQQVKIAKEYFLKQKLVFDSELNKRQNFIYTIKQVFARLKNRLLGR
jgi:SAM-dependent methyltransferase